MACFLEFFVIPRIENLKKNPLRPAIVTFVGRADTASLIVGKTKSSQLSTHVGDVRLGIDAWMNARDDCVLLGWQTKRVVSNRVQNVFASHSFVTTKNVGGDVAEWVTDMQTSPRRIRKHVEDEKFLSTCDCGDIGDWPGRVWRLEGVVLIPVVLPSLFDCGCQCGAVSIGGY